ncbi:MAG: outer membrane lipoprotein carrier protein LolA [Ideonella sp. MAG2]|nr:MAG: outer membrane lipoprotein carrier protein LolA [Ideonella sp. MAG2]
MKRRLYTRFCVQLLNKWPLGAAPFLAAACLFSGVAHADALDQLRGFVRDTKFGRADFTQTVTAPDGVKKKVSTGTFEFLRPNRFRFVYQKPYAQTIVGDGQKVWFYDIDLAQVTVRKMGDALGATSAPETFKFTVPAGVDVSEP